MKLPDFGQEPGWQQLRQRMGADQDGRFELHDPERHLSYAELQALADSGLVVSASQLLILKDRTLALKNRRVWLMACDAEPEQPMLIHLASCSQVNQWRHLGQRVSVSTRVDGIDGAMSDTLTGVREDGVCQVCMACLAETGYQGIDSRRIRRVDFAEQVRKDFKLAEFFSEFPSDWGG